MSDLLFAQLAHDHVNSERDDPVAPCGECGVSKERIRAKRLMTRDQVNKYLALSHEQVQSLINTRQITVIRLKGEVRFDSKELDILIETYKQTAQRRAR
ncbi:hypothetical protein [Granulicella tundricola]|uniref:Helix-turn-helix domain-containing protein n=1 Tax=Granulicella tundricola (strain ATCC BAA-1859 / DSM 23138 / MP5ACTX9) TaxID=1198114 RepID=E8X4Y0_GRATM|nr:hypothetical protein [Granulicella tundricola]ADW67172.1 hypothetical protein AciX9_0081 [Granulicella tundricola MP5ACTX9]